MKLRSTALSPPPVSIKPSYPEATSLAPVHLLSQPPALVQAEIKLMHSTLHVVAIVAALVLVPAGLRASTTPPKPKQHLNTVNTPIDHSKTLTAKSLTALSRSISSNLRPATAGRHFYISPTVTAIASERYGRGVRVSCTVRVAVMMAGNGVIKARTAIAETTARVIARRHLAPGASTDCIVAAASQLASRGIARLSPAPSAAVAPSKPRVVAKAQ